MINIEFKYKRDILLGTLMLLSMVILSSCGEAEEVEAEVLKSAVGTVHPEIGTVTDWHDTTAELNASMESAISFMSGGRIIELTANEGDLVTAGQYLGKIDTSALSAQYSAAASSAEAARSQARAADIAAEMVASQVDMASAAYDQAERDYSRIEALYEDNVATKSEYESAALMLEQSRISLQQSYESKDSAAAQAEAAWASARASGSQLAQISELIDEGTIYAPFTGYITNRYVDPGTVASPGMSVYRIVAAESDGFGSLEINYTVPESIVSKLRTGMTVYLSFDSCDTEIEGAIDIINREIDLNTRTVEITSVVAATSDCLLPGMFGTARIPLDIHFDSLLVPEDAIIELQGSKSVYVARDGVAHRVDVTTGIVEDGMVEIIDGISQSDEVIAVGNKFLADGALIRILNGSAETTNQESDTEEVMN